MLWHLQLLLIALGSTPMVDSAEIHLRPSFGGLSAAFMKLQSVRELSDGRVLVTDWADNKIYLADFGNGKVDMMSRRGTGGGQYRRVRPLLALTGDTTAMPDPENSHRWLVFNGPKILGNILATNTPFGSSSPETFGTDGEGNILAWQPPHVSAKREIRLMGSELLLVIGKRRANRVDTIGKLRSFFPPGCFLLGATWGCPSNKINAAGGDRAVMFRDGAIAIIRGDPYRVDWILPGTKRVTGPALDKLTSWTEADKKAFLQRQSAMATAPGSPLNKASGWPAKKPAFTTVPVPIVLAAPDGRVLVLRTISAAHPGMRYDMIDRKGVRTGVLVLPEGHFVLGFGTSAVYVVSTDEAGRQRLNRHPWP